MVNKIQYSSLKFLFDNNYIQIWSENFKEKNLKYFKNELNLRKISI